MTGNKRAMEDESTDLANEDHNAAECFHSADFEAGSYKEVMCVSWRKQEKNGDGYISLYLVLSKSNQLTFNQEVNVTFKLFIYDYIRDKYCNVQDDKARRFCGIRREWGFDKLVSLIDFKDESNGYLMDDCCIFGAEVLVIQNGSKGECLSMVKTPANNTCTWKIEKFSELDSSPTKSKVFSIGGSKWSIFVYPKGETRVKGKSLSIFLKLEDHASFQHGRKLYAEFMFTVRNQLSEKHHQLNGLTHQFDSSKQTWGFLSFLSLNDLNDKSKGFVHDNTLVVEVEIRAMTVIKGLS
ncbi:uncharacterized protein LOC130014956 [Mercurialis annua]|uniref:uncharacterized protein LOC130014956 n=1 Tax=Mercurialis annua TaxID=3986 RepID=UPI0024AE8EE2|nr:uncharacterized protein LOC130014956 [Mercurialis annua]